MDTEDRQPSTSETSDEELLQEIRGGMTFNQRYNPGKPIELGALATLPRSTRAIGPLSGCWSPPACAGWARSMR